MRFPSALVPACGTGAFCALALGAAACMDMDTRRGAEDPVDSVVLALGQPSGDYPGYEERVVLYGTNRARVSPATEGWAAYPAQPPMQWHFDLNRSARAHSLDMRDQGCFQHPSCDGTAPFDRIQTFYKAAWMSMGENIAAGVLDPLTVVHNWIYEIGATPGETGHRDSIFSANLTLIGVGFAAGGTGQFKNFWTQDFVGTPVTRPRLTDGIHFPVIPGGAGTVTFGTTYYEAGATAPPSVFVVVDGACKPLTMVRGTAALGAWEAVVPIAAGCHGYFFESTAGNGVTRATYPDAGALQVGSGAMATTCALFVTTRTEATCGGSGAGGGGEGGAGGVAGGGGAAGATAASGSGGRGSGGAGTGPTTGSGGASGNGGVGTVGAGAVGALAGSPGATGGKSDHAAAGAGCSVAADAGFPATGSAWLLAALLAWLAGGGARRRSGRNRFDPQVQDPHQ